MVSHCLSLVADVLAPDPGRDHGAAAQWAMEVRHFHLLRGHPPRARPQDDGGSRKRSRQRDGQPDQRFLVRGGARTGATFAARCPSKRGASSLALAGDLDRNQRFRKSTRLNSSHGYISYAVFCLKKKKKK